MLGPALVGQRRPDDSLLEKAAHYSAQDTQGALVLETFRSFFDFLQGHFRVFVQAFVIDEFADRALPLIHFLQDLFKIGHPRGCLAVKGIVLSQFAESALACVDLLDDPSGLGDR